MRVTMGKVLAHGNGENYMQALKKLYKQEYTSMDEKTRVEMNKALQVKCDEAVRALQAYNEAFEINIIRCLKDLSLDGLVRCKETGKIGKFLSVPQSHESVVSEEEFFTKFPFVAKFFPLTKNGSLSKKYHYCTIYSNGWMYDDTYDWIRGYLRYFEPVREQGDNDE